MLSRPYFAFHVLKPSALQRASRRQALRTQRKRRPAVDDDRTTPDTGASSERSESEPPPLYGSRNGVAEDRRYGAFQSPTCSITDEMSSESEPSPLYGSRNGVAEDRQYGALQSLK